MAQKNADPMFHSLKSKIRLAMIALAFFVCGFGIAAFLLSSALFTGSVFVVCAIFMLAGLAIGIFGWWLSSEIVRPVENVSLLAKSLERGYFTSLPKTSGSSETDDLLASLHRSSRQMQTLVKLMDQVAAGELNVALSPLENSDRLSESFQKLLSKVSESIHAKQELERIENAVSRIEQQAAPLKKGNLDIEISGEIDRTKAIADIFATFVREVRELVRQTKTGSTRARELSSAAHRILREHGQREEDLARELARAKDETSQIFSRNQNFARELVDPALSADRQTATAEHGAQAARENLHAAAELRKHLQEFLKRAAGFNERSQEIARAARVVVDLERRINLIALNASIRAEELGEAGRGLSLLVRELEHVAGRAGDTKDQLAKLDQAFSAEVGQFEQAIESALNKAVDVSRFAIETADALREFESRAGRHVEIQNRTASYAREQANAAEKILRIIGGSIDEIGSLRRDLQSAEDTIDALAQISQLAETATAAYRLPQAAVAERAAEPEYALALEAERLTL